MGKIIANLLLDIWWLIVIAIFASLLVFRLHRNFNRVDETGVQPKSKSFWYKVVESLLIAIGLHFLYKKIIERSNKLIKTVKEAIPKKKKV